MPVINIVLVAKKATRPSTPASLISIVAVAIVVPFRASAGETAVATVAVVVCNAAGMRRGQAVAAAAEVALQNPRASGARSESILVNSSSSLTYLSQNAITEIALFYY